MPASFRILFYSLLTNSHVIRRYAVWDNDSRKTNNKMKPSSIHAHIYSKYKFSIKLSAPKYSHRLPVRIPYLKIQYGHILCEDAFLKTSRNSRQALKQLHDSCRFLFGGFTFFQILAINWDFIDIFILHYFRFTQFKFGWNATSLHQKCFI